MSLLTLAHKYLLSTHCLSQDKSVASTAARLATAVMGAAGTDTAAPTEKVKSEVELARENMKKKKAGKKGKKKPESEVFFFLKYQIF